jgi:hypothetical protein
MSQPHVQLRNALLDDHVARGWMDSDMFLAYTIMLRHCDWDTGIWHGSADSLAALTGGQWSKATAVRVLRRLGQGRYITSRHVDKVRGNYDIAINNFIPTIGENIGKKLRRTKTRDYRIRIKSDSDKWATDQDHQRPCTESRVIRNQDLHSVPPTSGGVGVGVESEARGRHSRIANAIADARPECRQPAMQKTETQPQNQPQPEVAAEVPVPENEVPPVSQEDPSPGSAAPLPPSEDEVQAAFEAHLADDGIWLANYLFMFLHTRPDTEIIRPWERLWADDFNKALSDGYTKEDLMLAILVSQTPAAKKYYRRAGKICEYLDMLIEKGRKLMERGVLREHACKCGALFAMHEGLTDHQETCETAQAIDPEDAAEEEAMYAAEDAIGRGQMTDITEMTDPFAGEREDESWK